MVEQIYSNAEKLSLKPNLNFVTVKKKLTLLQDYESKDFSHKHPIRKKQRTTQRINNQKVTKKIKTNTQK